MPSPPRSAAATSVVIVSLHRDLRTLRDHTRSLFQRMRTRVDREVGGVQVHTDAARTLLQNAGHEVTLITPFDGIWLGPLAGVVVQKLLRPFSERRSERWRNHWHEVLLRRSLRRRRDLLLTARNLVVYAQSPLAAKVVRNEWPRRVAVVVVHHGTNIALPLPRYLSTHTNPDQLLWGASPELRPAYEDVDGFVFVSRYIQDQVLHNAAVNPEAQIAVIANFLPDGYGVGVKPDASLRGRDLVTTGRLSGEKNLGFLLDLVAGARRRGREITLTVVGDGTERHRLEAQSRSLGIDDLVRFVGRRSDIPSVLAAHKLYVHSSTIESFGFSIVEAMAVGLPVAAAPVGAVPDFVRDGDTGRLLDLDDIAASTSVVIDLLGDDDGRSAMARRGREWVHAHYTESTAGRQLVDFLTAIGRPPYAEARDPRPEPDRAQLAWSADLPADGRLMVGMATYNRAHYLRKAIASVQAQDVSDYVFRIVDDASTDDTPTLLAELGDPRVCFARQASNQGWLENCNTVLRDVGSTYVTLLGDDDLMLPGALSRAMDFLDAHPECSFVHAGMHLIGPEDEVLVADTNTTGDLHEDAIEDGATFIAKSMTVGNRVLSQTVMIRSELLPAVPFDPRDGPVADFTLWLKLALAGKVGFIATPSVSYRVHPGSDSARWSSPSDSGYTMGPAIVSKQREGKHRFIDEHEQLLVSPTSLRLRADAAAFKLYAGYRLGPRGRRWAKRILRPGSNRNPSP